MDIFFLLLYNLSFGIPVVVATRLRVTASNIYWGVRDFPLKMSALLARRFQQNWMDRYPHDACHFGPNLDDSLTSLAWLQNLRVSEFTQPRQTSSLGAVWDDSRNFAKQGIGELVVGLLSFVKLVFMICRPKVELTVALRKIYPLILKL